jgi:hypothetical protein
LIFALNFFEFGQDCLIGGVLEPQKVNHGEYARDVIVRHDADRFFQIPRICLPSGRLLLIRQR